jgi:hypothetical protein
MADEREGAQQGSRDAASESKIQSGGREANAAQPLNAAENKGGPERYPPANRTDGVESRSFDPSADAPTPRQGAGDTTARGHMGPGGDPAEGKR